MRQGKFFVFMTFIVAPAILAQSREDAPFWRAADEQVRNAEGNVTSATIKDRVHYTARVLRNGEWLTYHYAPHTEQLLSVEARDTTNEYSDCENNTSSAVSATGSLVTVSSRVAQCVPTPSSSQLAERYCIDASECFLAAPPCINRQCRTLRIPVWVSEGNCPTPTSTHATVLGSSVREASGTMTQLRNDPTGVYQRLHRRWLTTRFPRSTLSAIAAKVSQQYQAEVLARVPEVTVQMEPPESLPIAFVETLRTQTAKGIDETSTRVTTVHAQRLTLHVHYRQTNAGTPCPDAPQAGCDYHDLIAYFLNDDHATEFEHSNVIFAIHGHYICCPSLRELGAIRTEPQANMALGRLAMRGYPIIMFDDREVGESAHPTVPVPGKYSMLGLVAELVDLRAVEQALLLPTDQQGRIAHPWARIDVVGISGGAERALHYLMLHRSRVLRSAYVAGLPQSPWMSYANRACGRGPFEVNYDTYDEQFLVNFTWGELLLPAIKGGIDIAIAMNKKEPGLLKYIVLREMVPTLAAYTNQYQIRGDDPRGVGGPGWGLCHEYALVDFVDFLENSRHKTRR